MIYIDRFKYLGEDIEKMKKFINQKYYNTPFGNKDFIQNSLLIENDNAAQHFKIVSIKI